MCYSTIRRKDKWDFRENAEVLFSLDEGGGMAWNTERLWERQDGESGKAYEAFGVYRDMGATRTVSAVARQLRKSRALIDRWKRQWHWAERARAYDRELERAAHEEALMLMDLGYAAEGAGPLPNHGSRKALTETVSYDVPGGF